jgi:predicted nucleic acid-binding protein
MPAPAYFDSSVLVKRYVFEPGAREARDLLRRFRVLSSKIAVVEATSAACRRATLGELAPAALDGIVARLATDRHHWDLLDVDEPLLARAEGLIREFPIAALDAIHVASALVFIEAVGRRLPFVTSDARQRAAAERFELEVVWVA